MDENTLHRLAAVIEARRGVSADESYVASLFARGLDAILKKVGEESTEVLLAAKGEDRDALVHEMADLWFHCLVLLVERGVGPGDVLAELERRSGVSGHEEKARRS